MNKRGLTILFCFVCLKISTVKNMILCQSKQILQIKFVYNISVTFQNKILQTKFPAFSHFFSRPRQLGIHSGGCPLPLEVVGRSEKFLKCQQELYN